jgi:hypothetical protein
VHGAVVRARFRPVGVSMCHDPGMDAAEGAPGEADVGSATRASAVDPTLLLTPVLALVTILVISVPGWVPVASTLCVVGWVALIAIWTVGLVRKIGNKRSGRADGRPFWVFLVVPGFLTLVVLFAATDLPIRARFVLSRDELTDAATAVLEARSAPDNSRIGSIPIESVETNGVAVWFVTSGFGQSERWGFVYAPHGGLPAPMSGSLTAIDDGWYIFHEGSDRRVPVPWAAA